VVCDPVTLPVDHANQLGLSFQDRSIGLSCSGGDGDERPRRVRPVPVSKGDGFPLAVHPPRLGQNGRPQPRHCNPENAKRRTWQELFGVQAGALAQAPDPLAAIWLGNLPHSRSLTWQQQMPKGGHLSPPGWHAAWHTLARIPRLLAPGGRMLVVGLARPDSLADMAFDVVSGAANPVMGMIKHPRPVRLPRRAPDA
jgi:hypothetical protein